MKRLMATALLILPLLASADPDASVMRIVRESDIRWADNPAAPGL
jgi:hypothetical protein